jgi:phage terminase small subunit
MSDKLTDKQKQFCIEYLIDFNGTQAAVRAGYSPRTAPEQSSRLLNNVKVQNFIKSKQEKLETKADITREQVLAEYAKLAFFDIRKIFTVDGGLMPIRDIDDDSAAAIAGIESQDIKVEDMVIGKLNKVKVADKRAALDSICRVLGFNAPDKVINKNLNSAPLTEEEIRRISKALENDC